MGDFEPWVKYPGLTKQRLSAVAILMRDARDGAVGLHDPSAGDNPWSLGCRIYARTCSALRQFAKEHDWLTILDEKEGLRFSFSIGRVPLKFYRGDVDGAPSHCRIISQAESGAQQLLLDLEGIALDDRLLRLVIAAGNDSLTEAITLTELESTGTLTGKFVVPFEDESRNAAPFLAPGVDPGPPPIQPLLRQGSAEPGKRRERNGG